MRGVVQIGGLLLACAATGLSADQGSPANVPAATPARPVEIRPAPAPAVKKPAKPPQIGPPLSNPGSLAARLYRATPEQRERALEKLPFKMQEALRKQLDDFDRMPKEQQQVFIRRAERFAALSPERKAQVNAQLVALGKLPVERRREIGIALRRLLVIPEDDRQRVLSSDEFKSRFSAEEQKMIADLADVML